MAYALGHVRQAPLRTYEWLLLGLGLSTFSWSVLLLFAGWIFAMRWRERFPVQELERRRFQLLQISLVVLSAAAVVLLVTAIPYGLLANPDMRISGAGQSVHELHWFNDEAEAVLPAPWVISLSLWWYKAAMLMWALWLAFALARWLPAAWRAFGSVAIGASPNLPRPPSPPQPSTSDPAAAAGLWPDQGNRPKTATLFLVATKTFPSATTGTMSLLPAPNWSRPLDAWLLLYNSVARLVAA